MIEDAEDVIRGEFAKAGLPDVSVLPSESASAAWLIRSNASEHRLKKGNNLLIGSVSIASAADDGSADILAHRAAAAAKTLRALIDSRTPEEIPA